MPPANAAVTIAATLILLLGILLVIRQVDVRLVLFVSGVLLAALVGRPMAALDAFAQTLASANYVVPICCSMGFAFVLKFTGCDLHLVRLLVAPLKKVAALAVPGAVAVAFIVNTAVISQSSTAATVGPVLIPLLLATGLTPTMTGAALLIGSSVGGELLNAGAPEVIAVSEATGERPIAVIARTAQLAPLVAACATAFFWWRVRHPDPDQEKQEARAAASSPVAFPTAASGCETEGVNLVKAAVPLLPVLLLILDARLPGHLFPRPADPSTWKEWMAIAYAMLIGTGAAMLTAPRLLTAATGQFFQGQGFAYAHIISLIVAALTFVEGLKQCGLMALATGALAGRSELAVPAAVIVPGSMALLTGSGMAPSVTFIEAFLPHAPSWNVDAVGLGVVASQSAAIGRTCSPAAAVVMVCSALVGVAPLAVLRRAAPPLFIAWLVTLAAGFLLT
jgi:DcuC family C4-dicarboxylate transporter